MFGFQTWGRRAQVALAGFIWAASAVSVQAQTCAVPGRDGPLSLNGTVNSYYPPSTNGTFGPAATNIGLGPRVGSATPIAPGDLVVVMQMQCANIDASNSANYGAANGTGRGYTDPAGSCAAGRYEYVRAGQGSSNTNLALSTPLINTYVNDPSTATNRRTFQIIRVPQAASSVLSGTVTAPYWDGNVGGVVILDSAGQFNWNGQGISVAGRGFRGGGGRFWAAAADADTPPDWVDTLANAVHAYKGEGIAGTPRLVYDSDSNTRIDLGAAWGGYANGDLGRGAPGNAGGGGDNRDGGRDNGGGGGGGNGGIGGFGAYGWKSGGWAGTVTAADFDMRGIGGGAFLAPAANRVVMGGGGGSSAPNNSGNPPTVGVVDGASGGGIVIVRAGSMVGNGTVDASGRAALTNANNDGSGGGGAGGSVVLMSVAGSNGGTVNVNAAGGAGANSFLLGTTAHAGGGGGAGGIVIASGVPGIDVTGAANGTTNIGDNPVDANHGATPGGAGSGLTSQAELSSGVTSSARCLPNLSVAKSALSGTITAPGATTVGYRITVSNTGGMALGADLIDNTLPPGWTFASSSSLVFGTALSATVWGGFVESAPGVPAVANAPGGIGNLVTNGAPAASPTWSSLAIPGVTAGTPGRVTLDFVVNIPASAAVGCYHNPAGVKYIDPTRSTAGREVTPQTNNTANRAGAQVGGTVNVAYETNPGTSTIVLGANYSGLEGGPAGDDVCLTGDLSVTKSNPGTITAGATTTYNLVATNSGRAIRDLTYAADQANAVTNTNPAARVLAAGAVRVVDTLPAGVTLSGAITAPGWTCSTVGQTVTCDYGPPAVPITATYALNTITLPVRMTPAACPGPIANTATVAGFQAPYVESSTVNNTATVSSSLSCGANLSATKTDGTLTVVAGSTTTYTLTFANAGPASADGALINDTSSAGLSNCSVVSCTPSGSAVCPVAFTNFFSSGVAVPSLPASGQLTILVRCGVSATGL